MKLIQYVSFIILLSLSVQAEYRILAFGDSNTWGWKPDGSGTRFSDDERWAGVLQERLGEEYAVIVDGLVACRTNIDGLDAGPIDGSFLNGAKTLPAALARNAPLDLLIIFLGTNDVQLGAERAANEVASAVGELVDLAKGAESLLHSSYSAPREVWVVVPPPLGDLAGTPLEALFSPGYEASQQFEAAFQNLSNERGIRIFSFEALEGLATGADGIHLTLEAHKFLGNHIADTLDADRSGMALPVEKK
ncbi:MAG: GDSL-type esterase/lipase family protein [Opitutales bacterium]